MSIVVTARFTPVPERRPDLLAALASAAAEVHRESGCELYALQDGLDGSVWFIEKWASEAALDAHAAGDPVRRLDAAVADLIVGAPVVTRMRPVPAGTRHQGLL